MTKHLTLTIAMFCAVLAGNAGAAMPKAAEDESAPVAVGADAPRPKKSMRKPAPVQKKQAGRPGGKVKKVRHGKK